MILTWCRHAHNRHCFMLVNERGGVVAAVKGTKIGWVMTVQRSGKLVDEPLGCLTQGLAMQKAEHLVRQSMVRRHEKVRRIMQ